MEIESNGESKALIKPGSTLTFGRGQGFNSSSKTVSRRCISFLLDPRNEDRVRFEVIGKNPIWKHSKRTKKVEIFRPFSKGIMKSGDMFCVSAQNPIWFSLKKIELGAEYTSQLMGLKSLEDVDGVEGVEELDVESVDISNIDPIKEFGLVVMGHEFDGYGKRINLDARKWDWFIEEPEGEERDDDDDGDKRKGKRSGKRKKKKGAERDDEEWTGESEDEKELLAKSRKVPKPVYSTRSKKNSGKAKVSSKAQPESSGLKKTRPADEEDEEVVDEDEDENDETLGGFIVDDASDEDEDMDDDEDEEEFVEDELED